jgi:hypothetical protein
MPNPRQQDRLDNLGRVKEWVKEETDKGIKSVEIDRIALVKKAVLVLGCTRATAIEYIKEVLGE